MTSVESNNFQRYYWENRTIYTHRQRRETQTFRKLKTYTTSLLEVEHYQNALKRGEFSTAKQKIQNEKRKYFKKSKMVAGCS